MATKDGYELILNRCRKHTKEKSIYSNRDVVNDLLEFTRYSYQWMSNPEYWFSDSLITVTLIIIVDVTF